MVAKKKLIDLHNIIHFKGFFVFVLTRFTGRIENWTDFCGHRENFSIQKYWSLNITCHKRQLFF